MLFSHWIKVQARSLSRPRLFLIRSTNSTCSKKKTNSRNHPEEKQFHFIIFCYEGWNEILSRFRREASFIMFMLVIGRCFSCSTLLQAQRSSRKDLHKKSHISQAEHRLSLCFLASRRDFLFICIEKCSSPAEYENNFAKTWRRSKAKSFVWWTIELTELHFLQWQIPAVAVHVVL